MPPGHSHLFFFPALPKTIQEDAALKVVLDVVGQDPETCLFAIDLSLGEEVEKEDSHLGGQFYDARKALFILNDKESSLVSQVNSYAYRYRVISQ